MSVTGTLTQRQLNESDRALALLFTAWQNDAYVLLSVTEGKSLKVITLLVNPK